MLDIQFLSRTMITATSAIHEGDQFRIMRRREEWLLTGANFRFLLFVPMLILQRNPTKLGKVGYFPVGAGYFPKRGQKSFDLETVVTRSGAGHFNPTVTTSSTNVLLDSIVFFAGRI